MADDNKTPKPPKDPEPFPVAEEAPLPKGVPDEPQERAAMMAAENAASLSTATLSSSELKERNDRAAQMARENSEANATMILTEEDREGADQRAALLAQEATGTMVPDAAFRKTL